LSWANKDSSPLFEQKMETKIEERFLERLFQYLQESGEGRVKGVHVSDIIYPCARKGYYNALMPPLNLDIKGAIRIWTGIELHKMPLCKQHELSLSWRGINGTVDEYENGLFFDKKSTRNIPTYYDRKRGAYVVKIREHHLRQLEYYRVLLEENNYNVDVGGILYINVDDASIMAGIGDLFARELEAIKEEMLERSSKLSLYLNTRTLPPRDMSVRWMCVKGYCPFVQQCMLNINPTEFLKQEYLETRWSVINEIRDEDFINGRERKE